MTKGNVLVSSGNCATLRLTVEFMAIRPGAMMICGKIRNVALARISGVSRVHFHCKYVSS